MDDELTKDPDYTFSPERKQAIDEEEGPRVQPSLNRGCDILFFLPIFGDKAAETNTTPHTPKVSVPLPIQRHCSPSSAPPSSSSFYANPTAVLTPKPKLREEECSTSDLPRLPRLPVPSTPSVRPDGHLDEERQRENDWDSCAFRDSTTPLADKQSSVSALPGV